VDLDAGAPMIDTTAYALFCVAALTLAITPGPTVLMALSNAISGGRRAAFAGMAGVSIASLLLIAAVALGLGALLAASSTLFEAMRGVGVLYLCWLGIKLWRAGSFAAAMSPMPSATLLQPPTAFMRSFTVGISNPKALLFFTAFLPQFIDPVRPLAPQYSILGVTFAAFDVLVMTVYVFAGIRAVAVLSQRSLKLINRGCAVAMFMLAAALAAFRRSSV
jgi:threonine/homoserine/homoserine lactone efflux protein